MSLAHAGSSHSTSAFMHHKPCVHIHVHTSTCTPPIYPLGKQRRASRTGQKQHRGYYCRCVFAMLCCVVIKVWVTAHLLTDMTRITPQTHTFLITSLLYQHRVETVATEAARWQQLFGSGLFCCINPPLLYCIYNTQFLLSATVSPFLIPFACFFFISSLSSSSCLWNTMTALHVMLF